MLKNVKKSYDFQLSKTEREIFELYQDQSLSKQDIAKKLNLTRSHVSRIVNSKKFQTELKKLYDQADKILLEAKKKAAKVLVSQLDSKDEKIAQNAAIKILGPLLESKEPVQKNEIIIQGNIKQTITQARLTMEEIEKMTTEEIEANLAKTIAFNAKQPPAITQK